ncbi:MAG: hypothetical protein K8R76_01065 [Candidatus Aegiribacteria sp.]|nr:hypothetical protein [Candidatus Aegiribacteria sp.]
MKQPVALLRWHLCRKDVFREGYHEKPEEIQVTVSRGSDFCLKFWRSRMNDPLIIVRDVFSWWDESADEIQSWVRADLFIEALTQRNLLLKQDDFTSMKTPRVLAEDMVFLQFMFHQKQFDRIWSKAFKGREELEKVIMIPSSRWLNFTQQAREASSTMYGILLKASTVGVEDDQE